MKWHVYLLKSIAEVVQVAYIASEELHIFVMVPLHKVEYGHRLLATGEELFDYMTAEESTPANDQVRVLSYHCYCLLFFQRVWSGSKANKGSEPSSRLNGRLGESAGQRNSEMIDVSEPTKS